jgi:hypothetical protein
VVVYGDVAQFVDQDDGIGECRLSQQVIEQRRLAGPQKTGKDGHRDCPLRIPSLSRPLPNANAG